MKMGKFEHFGWCLALMCAIIMIIVSAVQNDFLSTIILALTGACILYHLTEPKI